jgi:prolyl oligopeptidase
MDVTAAIRLATSLAFAVLLIIITVVPAQTQKPSYPTSRKSNVVDHYFGTEVADPYRWMEDLDSAEVAAWVAAQNAVTEAYLGGLPLRETFRKRITALWDYPKTTVPVREGGRYFYRKNSGLERQSPIYMRASLDAPAALVIDPNVLSPDGSVSLSQFAPSPDARWLAYALAQGGADWETIHVHEIAAGRALADEIQWVRFSNLAWTKDARGFFYSRYPEPPKGKELEASLSGHAIYYHVVGTAQSQDRLIYERKDLPGWFIGASVTEDGRYLLVVMAKGSENKNRLYYADLANPRQPVIGAPVRPIVEADDAEFEPVGNVGSVLYLRTDRGAPNRKVIAIDVQRTDPSAWKTIVPEQPRAMERVALIGGRLVIHSLHDVQSRLTLFGLDGRSQGEIGLPATGSVADLGGRQDSREVFYSFSSPLYPTTVFAYDPQAKHSASFESARPDFDVERYETKPLFAQSKDGTRVPFFLTARKDLARDGSHPTILYGYGGFSVTTLPMYRPEVPAWLEADGVWVTANMRGGAEYGEAWHRAGMLDGKQHVFDDFIAVAEYLVKEKYTSPAKLSVNGGSNGGLLVGAVMEQRPDLYAVALPQVGVMDMLRYDKFTAGRFWVTEYGSSSDEHQFKTLLAYSPLHNVKSGVCYPATLVTTADHDDRVVPSHSFKFTAALQAAQACDKPVLIRIEVQGSHGYRPTDKRIAELADMWAFAAAHLGMSPPAH